MNDPQGARAPTSPAIVALYADDMLGRARETPDALDAVLRRVRRARRRAKSSSASATAASSAPSSSRIIQQLSYRGVKVAEIEAVRVADRPARRAASAPRSIRFGVERARAAGCVRVQLTSNKERIDAHRFYERLGFRRSHEGFKLYF